MPTPEDCTERRVQVAVLSAKVDQLERSQSDIKEMVSEMHEDFLKAKSFVGAVVMVTGFVVSAVWAIFTHFSKS